MLKEIFRPNAINDAFSADDYVITQKTFAIAAPIFCSGKRNRGPGAVHLG
jgi:hypothetical protein